ncbi:MAG: autotransporter domain-containing protein [Pseudomonadota bacterium]
MRNLCRGRLLERLRNPTPTQSYIAYSRYNTYSVAFKNELGPIFKLSNGYSIKPDVGLQLNGSKQTKLNEQNAGIYAQNYKASTAQDGEIYGGIGVRKQWKGETYEGKITLKYEVGQKSGNGKSSTTIYTAIMPSGVSSTSTKPGLFAHYINLYGSLLNMESNWKFVPGVTVTLQKGQRSVSGTLKFEHRF